MPDKQTVLLPAENDPTISFRLWFKVGSQNDPVGKEGLANLTSMMLAEGATESRSYDEIVEALYPLAASYHANTHVEQSIFYGRVHSDKLDKYYDLYLDALLNPAFVKEDLDRLKSRVLNYLKNTLRYSSDEELGKAALYNFVYNGTPYGHIPEGTVSSIESITVEDVRDFYEKYYTKDNVVIGIGGGFNQSLVLKLQNDLGQLPDGKSNVIATPSPDEITGKELILVEKDANATAISIGFPIDILRGSREWYALALANSWFGEHRNSSSHLYQVIREARGLNYGDYSYIERYPNGGSRSKPPQNVSLRQQMFEIWIRPVPNENGHFALRAAIRELEQLVENGLTEEQFQLTQEFFSKYVLHYAPTTMARLGYALDDEFYGISGSHLENLRTIIPELTREEVNQAIRQHLQYKNMKIAMVVPDAEQLKDALINEEQSPIEYSTPKDESVYEEDEKIQSYPLDISADDVTITKVEEMFE
ncbi:MAG: insulinase family protein [Candidatus Marinimicrobia bacterium]|nr:insulinase family protein [Candidatus Neomarinimicrobiota bacterium]MCF7880262.1 insulinase family protein [Candidatus Neomarinimicrobiota bacterium]